MEMTARFGLVNLILSFMEIISAGSRIYLRNPIADSEIARDLRAVAELEDEAVAELLAEDAGRGVERVDQRPGHLVAHIGEAPAVAAFIVDEGRDDPRARLGVLAETAAGFGKGIVRHEPKL